MYAEKTAFCRFDHLDNDNFDISRINPVKNTGKPPRIVMQHIQRHLWHSYCSY